MIKVAEKNELTQVSLTGIRSIVLLGLLIIAPRSLEEIRKIFLQYNIIDESSSNDILRIDINTLKYMGCEISRASAKTDFKYVLGNHPFSLNVTLEEIKLIKRFYKIVKKTADIPKLLVYDDFFKKIAKFISNENKEAFLGISVLKHFDIKLIKSLLRDCDEKALLTLDYISPDNQFVLTKKIAAKSLEFRNDKIYLHGFDIEKNKWIILNLKRIQSIWGKNKNNGDYIENKICTRFMLKSIYNNTLEDNEKVIDKIGNNCIVEGVYFNKFLCIQRRLSFGANCTVLEPLEIKNKIIELLQEMRKIYEQ